MRISTVAAEMRAVAATSEDGSWAKDPYLRKPVVKGILGLVFADWELRARVMKDS